MGKTIILLLVVCTLIGVSISTPLMAADAGLKTASLQDASGRGPPSGSMGPPPDGMGPPKDGMGPQWGNGGPPPPSTTASSG